MEAFLECLFALTSGTVLILFALSTLGALVVRSQIEDPYLSFGLAQPIIALICIAIYLVLHTTRFIDPILTTEWIKGMMVSTTIGNGLGIGLVLLVAAKADERKANVETELERRKPVDRRQSDQPIRGRDRRTGDDRRQSPPAKFGQTRRRPAASAQRSGPRN